MARKSATAWERNQQYCKEYYAKHAQYCYRLVRDWQARNEEKMTKFRKVNLIQTIVGVIFDKLLVIDAYGGKCACCGEDTYEFMTIDHKENDGHTERHLGTGQRLYQRLRRMGFPQDRYQLHCWNCNCAKGRYGYCPHEIEQRVEYGLSGC